VIYVPTWSEERRRLEAALDPATALCVDWSTVQAAYMLATHQLTIPAPAGYETFSYGRLPLIEGCMLPELTTRGVPWLAIAGVVGLLAVAAYAASGKSRGARTW
jgi:hypothetical protein